MAIQQLTSLSSDPLKSEERDLTPQRQGKGVGRHIIFPRVSSKWQLLRIFSLIFMMMTPIPVTHAVTNSVSDEQKENMQMIQDFHYEKEFGSYQQESKEGSQFLDPRITRDPANENSRPYDRLSRALQRIHFGPFLRLTRPVYREVRQQQKQFNLPNPREKKALSFFSRFYPVLQHGSSIGGGGDYLNNYTQRRRVSFSGEGFPVSRFTSRPIMRLRWGK